MKNIIKIFTLLAVMLCTAGNSFASAPEGNPLGYIAYTHNSNDGGELKFYVDLHFAQENSTSLAFEDGKTNTLDDNLLTNYTVYIKATADIAKCFGPADADGKVSFIKVEQTISSNAAQSRTRADIDLGFVDVYATETQDVYYFQMPDDKNINVKVSVEFPDTQVSIEGWTYSEAANAPTLSAGTNTGTGVAYTYKQQDAADDTYTDAVPTQAGKYTVRAIVNGNYTTTANFTIAQKALAITAEAKTKVYSEKDPALTYQQSGLVKGDAISGALARAEGENAGEYAISLGTIAASSNYAISFTGAKFTISKKPLTITADDKTKVYGEKDPALTYQQSGLVEGDAFSGALARVEGENVGEYAINQGTLAASDNYTVSFTGAKLTITAATLTGVSATGYEGTFDGQAHTIKVTAPEGATIKYGTEEGEYNLEAAPEYTTDGTYTVYYQVSKANYTTVTGRATVKINPSAVVDENNSEQIGDEVFYQPKEEVQNAIQNTIETGVAFTGEAANKATVNEQGELEFAQGENVNIALTDQKKGDVVKLVFEGKMMGDSEKLALKNAPAASRGTRAKDDMELISGAEYEVLQSGNIVLTVATQEAPVTLKGITSTPANTSDIRTIDGEQYAIDSWYDMNGRKLQGKPTRKGMYIHSGLKTIIK